MRVPANGQQRQPAVPKDARATATSQREVNRSHPAPPPLPPPPPPRTPQPRCAVRRYLAAARSSSPELAGGVCPSVRPSYEPRSSGQNGGPAAGDAPQRGDGKEPSLALRVLPLPAGGRCLRGRVLSIAAPRAQGSPLARRLSAGTQQRAGAARLGWSPAPGCMLIRRGGGVPRFLRPTTGAGWRASAAAPKPVAPHPPRLLRSGHWPWPWPRHVRPGPRGGAGGSRRVRARSLSLQWQVRPRLPQSGLKHLSLEPRGGHPLVGVTYPYPCAASRGVGVGGGEVNFRSPMPSACSFSLLAILSRESRESVHPGDLVYGQRVIGKLSSPSSEPTLGSLEEVTT